MGGRKDKSSSSAKSSSNAKSSSHKTMEDLFKIAYTTGQDYFVDQTVDGIRCEHLQLLLFEDEKNHKGATNHPHHLVFGMQESAVVKNKVSLIYP